MRRSTVVDATLQPLLQPAESVQKFLDSAFRRAERHRSLRGLGLLTALWMALLHRRFGRTWMTETYLSDRIKKFGNIVQSNFFVRVAQLDDYALVTQTTSSLDELIAIGIVIRSRRIINKKQFADIFKGNGPLSKFSDKISVASLLGIVTGDVLHDIGILKKIRNDFVHNHEFIDFSDRDTSNRCKSLKLRVELKDEVKELAGTAEREAFLTSCAACIIHIWVHVQIAVIEDQLLTKHKDERSTLIKAAAEKMKNKM